MKSFLFSLILLLFSVAGFAQGQLEFKETTLELKNLKADDQPTTVVCHFKNTGVQPVILTRVVPFSSSLIVDWPKAPIAPGKTGEIKIKFIPTQLKETFSYKIMIYSNAHNNRTEIVLSGNIVDNPAKPFLLYKYDMEGLRFKTNSIGLGNIYTWQVRTDTLTFYNTQQNPIKLSVQYQPDYIRTKFIPEQVAPGQRGSILITYDAPKKNDYGFSYESIILTINDNRNYTNRLSLTANLIEDFSKLSKKELERAPIATFEKKEISFGEIKAGAKATCDFKLTNTGKSDLIVHKTKASCGCTAVTLGQKLLTPGQSTVIRSIFDSQGKSGRQYKSITIITNDPKNPETILTINGNIK